MIESIYILIKHILHHVLVENRLVFRNVEISSFLFFTNIVILWQVFNY